MGGLEAIQKRNEEKAAILYNYLDQSKLFKGTVRKEDRSLMNVPFVTGDKDLDAKFVAEAKAAGLENLKGHRTVGGMRASIYNAMPVAGVEALVAFMKKFEAEKRLNTDNRERTKRIMYTIQTLNKIAAAGTKRFDTAAYTVTDTAENPDAIMVRSAAMHDMTSAATCWQLQEQVLVQIIFRLIVVQRKASVYSIHRVQTQTQLRNWF